MTKLQRPLQPATNGAAGIHRLRRESGVGLIEVLISLVVFAIGMLGLAGFQAKALEFSQVSLQRSQASALTDDVLDRMRADRANAVLTPTSAWATTLAAKAATITGASLSATDLRDWKTQLEALLPQGEAEIEVVPATGQVTVTITWLDDRNSRSPPTVQSFVTTTRL